MRGGLSEQHELRLRRSLGEAAQQFENENLRSAVFAAGKDRRQIDRDGVQLPSTA